MIELALCTIAGMVIGGIIVYMFKDQITADEKKVIDIFKAEAAKVKTAHTEAVVTKIVS